MKNLYLPFIVILVLFSYSCRHSNKNNYPTSGRIDYSITYLEHNLDDKSLELMPKSMKLYFNKKRAENFIEGFMGFYKLNAYTDFRNRTCSTLLKVFDKYYLFEGRKDELMCCFDPMENMEIRQTDETKSIAGFNSYKCIVTVPSFNEPFEIYYTDEIDLQHPNVSNPYKKIDGVLMEFELKLLDMRMLFTAEKFQPLPEHRIESDIPKKSKAVNRDQMTQILKRLMEF